MLIQTRTRLYDLRNKMAAVGLDAAKAKFVKQHGKDALEDSDKRVQFGLEWCKEKEFKFVYSGYDNGVSDFPIVGASQVTWINACYSRRSNRRVRTRVH